LQRREQNLIQKISEQEEKRKELEEEKKKVDKKAEEYNRLITLLKQQQHQEERQEEERGAHKEETDTAVAKHIAQLVRPPRTKLFSFRRYIQKILGSDSGSKTKVDNPLPNRMENMRAIRRITSSPGNAMEKKTSNTSISSMDRHGAPSKQTLKGHKRRSSDEIEYRGETKTTRLIIIGLLILEVKMELLVVR
jgi:hypothetical protein